jgi:hypothetical protein
MLPFLLLFENGYATATSQCNPAAKREKVES